MMVVLQVVASHESHRSAAEIFQILRGLPNALPMSISCPFMDHSIRWVSSPHLPWAVLELV